MPTRSVDNMEGRENFKDIDITKDEADRIAKAFENEEFRKLFKEYAEEIADPENRKRYEEEIAILEGERGMDVKFVNPDPGYVIKTSQNGDMKVFINICKNEHIAKPTASRKNDDKGRTGLAWQIPHSFAPPREDIDNGKNKCMVYDVVFNPDTYRMAETNASFKKLIQDTALDGIEKQFSIKLDKKNLKFPKLKFKGVARPTVIRTKKAEGPKEVDPNDPFSNMPYPYNGEPSDVKAEENVKKTKNKVELSDSNMKNEEKTQKTEEYVKPTYTITHRNEVDFQDYTTGGPCNYNGQPKELVVAVDLPLLSSSKNVNLDIFEKKLILQSEKPAKYKIDVDLPYAVNEENGSAKFDKAKRRLVVTLPVIKTGSESEEVNVNTNCSWNGHTDEFDGAPEIFAETTEAQPIVEVIQEAKKEVDEVSCEEKVCNTEENASDMANGLNEDMSDHVKNPEEEIDKDTKRSEGQIYYSEPQCDFHQDETTVSVIIKVSNVQEESVSKTYPGEPGTTFGLKFVSTGMGGFPMHYSLLLQTTDSSHFKVAANRVDVDDRIIVLLLSKDASSHGLWDKILIGKDEGALQEKYFVTDRTLRAELEDLEAAAMPSAESSPELQVTDMNENKLAITVKSQNGSESPPESPESYPDVLLVQEQKSPKLQSILKQRSRTVSESSDEVFTYSRENSVSYAGSESPISESEEGGEGEPGRRVRKKSVSFSEKVDQQTYKQNMPTTSLRATLKNKAKKLRKAERKHQDKRDKATNRRHRNSDSVSEMSSDGEGSSTLEDLSSNHDDPTNGGKVDVIDNVGVKSENDNRTTGIEDANGNITTPNGETPTMTNNVMNNNQKNRKNKRKNKRNKKQGHKVDEVASDGHQPPETSSQSSQSEDVDAHECCDNEKVVSKKKLVEVVTDDGADSDDNGEDDSPEDGERTSDQKETILKLNEGMKAAGDGSQCPVSFTNSVMFDLD